MEKRLRRRRVRCQPPRQIVGVASQACSTCLTLRLVAADAVADTKAAAAQVQASLDSAAAEALDKQLEAAEDAKTDPAIMAQRTCKRAARSFPGVDREWPTCMVACGQTFAVC